MKDWSFGVLGGYKKDEITSFFSIKTCTSICSFPCPPLGAITEFTDFIFYYFFCEYLRYLFCSRERIVLLSTNQTEESVGSEILGNCRWEENKVPCR